MILYCLKDEYLQFVLLLFDINSLSSSRDIAFLLNFVVNIVSCHSLYIPGDFPGLKKIKNFRV